MGFESIEYITENHQESKAISYIFSEIFATSGIEKNKTTK